MMNKGSRNALAALALVGGATGVSAAANSDTPDAVVKPYVRSDVQAYLDILKENPRPSMNAATIAAIRNIPPAQMAMMMSGAEKPLGALAVDKTISMPGPSGPIELRLFDARADRAPGPVLVFYHGGGFVVGSIATHAPLAAEIARRLDVPVVSVEYRLAPEHKWPAAPDDAEAAARWVAINGATFGRSVTGLILAGDSAGGTLTLVTALALRDRPAAVPVKLTIPLYPMADASKPYPSATEFGAGYGLDKSDAAFFEKALAADKKSARHSALLADLKGFPPTVLATASLDPLRDGGRAFAAKLMQAGVPVSFYEAEGNIHGYTTFRKAIPSAQDDLDIIMGLAKAMLTHQKADRR